MTEPKRVEHTHIGGQAVIEGVMMRGARNWAVAVREPSGSIYLESHDLPDPATRPKWSKRPIARGVYAFVETMKLAMQAFSIAASHAGETEEDRLSSKEVGFTMVAGVALAVGLFVVVPAVVTDWIVGPQTARPFVWNAVDGVLRLLVFFAYIVAISRMGEIRRVFAYHGAEHKTIHAYEHGVPLEPEAVQRFGTLHVRCGTAFLLMVMIIAILVFSLVPGKAILAAAGVSGRGWTLLFNIGVRIVLIPLIAGLAYEVSVKWAGTHAGSPLVAVVTWPGMQLQRLTTAEPDDGMVEVAIAAMNAVLERERDEALVADAQQGSPADQPPAID
ncbi:MAG: DUF1385 domain-containing protein [Anaerosomatales bacterium]|nr:DUF1385 domain-containing protein [Anaerosomatales bacterium]